MNLEKILADHTLWLRSQGGSMANLLGANLSGAMGILQFGPMRTSGRIIYAVWHDGWKVKAGCFWGTLDELEQRVKDSHNCPLYLSIISLLRDYSL